MATILKIRILDGTIQTTIPDNATTKDECNVEMDVVFSDRNDVESSTQHIVVNSLEGQKIFAALQAGAISWDDQQQLAGQQTDLDEDLSEIPTDTDVEFDRDLVGTDNGAIKISFFADADADNTKDGGENYSITGINTIVLYKDGVFYQSYAAASYPTGVFYEEVPAGDYVVNVVFNQYYTTANPNYYPNGAIDGVEVTAGKIRDIGDFSVTPGGELQIHAFVDADGDGNQDAEEPNGNLPSGTFLRVTPDGGSAFPDFGFEIESGSRTVTLLPGQFSVEVIVNNGLYTVTGGANPITNAMVIASTTNNLGNRGIAQLP